VGGREVRVTKILAVIWNTYREAARARVLHGLVGLALASAGYAIIVGQYASKHAARVLSDLGVASLSTFAVIVAVVLGATSLYREIELKTIYPILARPIGREQYLFGKFCGTLLTLLVFMAFNAGTLLLCLAVLHGGKALVVAQALLLLGIGVAFLAWRAPLSRTYLPVMASGYLLFVGHWHSAALVDERQVICIGMVLSLCEVAVVTSVALFFSSFSSPFLTAVCTFGLFIVGRSADSLAKLPERVFGPTLHEAALWLSRVVPNLMVYVPPRSILVGASIEVATNTYVAWAAVQAGAWCLGLLAIAGLIFRRRDFV
jgi:Cu-processing system permease protein